MPLSRTDHAPTLTIRGGAWAQLVAREGRSLLRLAAPIVLIALVNMGMSITDTAMVSALFGAEALASVAVGSDLYSILFYLGAGVLGGLSPFYTAAVVQANPAERLRLERIGRTTVMLLGLLLAPLVWSAPGWLAAIGLEPSLLQQGRGYIRAMALTLLPMLGVTLYRTILTAAERPKAFLKVTLAMLPLNAAANWALMLGAGPLPALGPTGAGVSSLLVASASLTILVGVARGGNSSEGAASFGPRFDWRGMAAVLRVGLPIGIATLAEVGIFLAVTIYAATLGAADVAAHTLTLRTAGVAYAVPTALLQASMVRMARAHALGDLTLQRAVAAGSLLLSVAFGVTICLALVFGARPLAQGFFGGDEASVAAAGIAAGLLVLLGFFEFLVGPGSAAAGLLRGRKDTRAPMLCTLIGHWAVGAPIAICLCEVAGLGITGVWAGLGAGTLLSTVLMLWRLHVLNRRSLMPLRADGTNGPFAGDSGAVAEALAPR